MLVFEPQTTYHTARNAVFWTHTPFSDETTLTARGGSLGVYCVNVGKQLAGALAALPRGKFFHLEVKDELDRLLRNARNLATSAGAGTLGLYNLGILCEPELQLDGGQIIKDHTRDGAVLLFWGGLSNGTDLLYWTLEDSRTHMRFPGVTLQQVILPHAV